LAGGAVVLRRRSGQSNWRTAIVAGGLAAAAVVAMPDIAGAQGFFDFLFGGPKQEAPPPSPSPVAPKPPSGVSRVTPAPIQQENVTEGGGAGSGHSVGFCVRLCDGQHFPMEQMANATPAETCKAICPNSATKVFVGAEVANAVSSDGQRYSALNTAFLYRKRLVANCTCNGKDPFGLATLDVRNDPTLRPGDIVATKQGFMSYNGKTGASGGLFTPATAAALSVGAASKQRLAQPAAPPDAEIEDEPGTIVPASTSPQGGAARAPSR
jgi:Protein of unknown function (DUF2865)